MRTVITGGPRTGKTTLAATYTEHVEHTDALIDQCEWSEASERVAGWFDRPGPWVVEGVAAVRALRKWLANNPEGRPCDVVVWLDEPKVEITDGQDTMAKGCATIWSETEPGLVERGVIIELPDA